MQCAMGTCICSFIQHIQNYNVIATLMTSAYNTQFRGSWKSLLYLNFMMCLHIILYRLYRVTVTVIIIVQEFIK